MNRDLYPASTEGGSDHDKSAEQAPEGSPIEFSGNATEYFGIWLSNTVLGILTLGAYSAWAKVRRSRYFLGNTIVLGDRLEYHATGMTILKGRLIAVAAIAVYVGIGFVSTVAQTVVAIVLVPVYPWVINRAMRFNARMTSWRNVRFDWHGTYWGVAKIYLLWPIVAVLTLGALAPMAARASRSIWPATMPWAASDSAQRRRCDRTMWRCCGRCSWARFCWWWSSGRQLSCSSPRCRVLTAGSAPA